MNTDELIKKIKELEKSSNNLEPEAQERKSLRNAVVDYTEEFLDQNASLPAFRAFEDYHLDPLKAPFKENGEEIKKIVEDLSRSMDHSGINPASGKHLGYIPGGGIFTSALGDYWADITNRYSGIFYASPGAVKIENEVIRWAIKVVGYPDEAWGSLLSGGSNANLSAIITARESKLPEITDYPTAVIYLTSQTHHCVYKALKLAGLHHAQVREIKVDDRYKMDLKDLETQLTKDLEMGLKPFLIVASVGTTDTGAVDPVNKIANIAEEYNMWFHIDAAYGGFFLLTHLLDDFRDGISRSDSIVMDPHKSMFMPYGLGIFLARDSSKQKKSFSYSANYLQDILESETEISPADVSPELTKHFRGLRMWLPMKIHGIGPFRAALEEKHLLALYLKMRLTELEDFETGPDPELSVVLFRLKGPNQPNQELVKQIHDDGTVFVSTTTINGVFWIRAAILVFRTHRDTIDLFINLLERFNDRIKGLIPEVENEIKNGKK